MSRIIDNIKNLKEIIDVDNDPNRALDFCFSALEDMKYNPVLVEHFSNILYPIDHDVVINILYTAKEFNKLNAKSKFKLFKITNDNGLLSEAIEFSDAEENFFLVRQLALDIIYYNTVFRSKNNYSVMVEVLDSVRGLNSKKLNEYITPFCNFFENIQPEQFLTNVNDVFAYILEKIVNRVPFSFVRLGDGEGCFLRNGSSTEEDQNFMFNLWFGKHFSSLYSQDFIGYLESSIESADLVGVPMLNRYIEDFTPDYNNRNYRALGNIYNSCQLYEGKIITSAFLHMEIYRSEFFKKILKASGEISLITGHDEVACRNKLKSIYNIDVDIFIKIPTEHKFKKLFNHSELYEPQYPDIFKHVVDYLNKQDLKNKVFLVCAGFLGKYYAHIIKKNGGIALDMGSAIDYILGFKTRRH